MNHKYEVGERVFYFTKDCKELIEVEIERVYGSPSSLGYNGDYNVRVLENSITFDVYERELINYITLEFKPKECECGKLKHNFASHTDWCPIKD